MMLLAVLALVPLIRISSSSEQSIINAAINNCQCCGIVTTTYGSGCDL
jgi:hypothetical protein